MPYQARVRLPDRLSVLLRSQLQGAIEEANLGNVDRLIATRYFLERIPQIDIAAELNIERSSVSRKLPKIIQEITRTAEKLDMFSTENHSTAQKCHP